MKGKTISQSEWNELLYTLHNVQDVDRAVQACKIIGQVANEAHIPDLYALLQSDDFFIRETVAEPLARLEGVKALPALLEALTRGVADGQDNDGLSTTVIGVLEENAADVAPLLLAMLQAEDATTRAHAAWGLGFVTEHITAEPLLAVVRHETNAEVKAAAIGSLAVFKDNPVIVQELIEALEDSNSQVRISAISSLGYLGDSRAITPLQEILAKSDSNVSRFAVEALHQLQPKGLLRDMWRRYISLPFKSLSLKIGG